MSPIVEKLVDLIPIAAGALIALASGALKYWSDRSQKRADRRLEKLERLVHLTYQVGAWTDSLDAHHTFGTAENGETEFESPIEELQVIANIYFPELLGEVEQFARTGKLYHSQALSLGVQRLKNGTIAENANSATGEG